MHVLQVISHYVPAYRFGGPLKVAHALGVALVRRGHSVTVCTTNQATEEENLDVPTDVPVELDGVTVFYETVPFLRKWGFSPRLWRRVSEEMQRADVALIHAHYQFANWAGARMARKQGVPYIVFVHSTLHREGISHKSTLRKRAYLAVLERQNLKDALFIAFNAPEEKAYSLYSERGEVVPSGIDPGEFAHMPPSGWFREEYPELLGKTVLLFLGRLDVAHKGLDMLIPVLARLCREHPDVHLVLAGPDEEGGMEQVVSLAAEHGVEQAITLTGLISGERKLGALQDADIFVLPSRFEGLSIALLEALYVGLPVLVTDQVGLCTEIEQARVGRVVPVDQESLYTSLKDLVVNKALREQMRGRGTALMRQKYTWDAIALGLEKQVQERLSSTGRSGG